jgi:methionyl-tRNA synthetase
MRDAQRILVTSALPYANGPIHLGHIAGAYLPADLYVRFQRLRGREIVFICGSDEHGVPITLTAEKEGVTPQQVVDRYHALNAAAFARLGIGFDNYSRTSLPLHHHVAQEFFAAFHARGILREKQEQQFYDEQAGMFLPDRYVEGTCPVCANPDARGDQCEKCGSDLNPTELISPRSKISGRPPVLRPTSHWYFPLGEFQARLEEYVRERDASDGWKENVLQYCRGWFREGLQDRAVTRDLDWGVRVPLPGYDRKVLYVWFEAVLGYISSTREWAERTGAPDRWKDFWQDPRTKYVAFIGKDNVVFHCIVFPAILMAWNDRGETQYVLPENVPANEFLNFEGQKFSKSRGWGIDVQEFLDRFPPDTLRYYMAVTLPEYRDSDFTWRDFQARTNNELADIFGNFVNRTLAFAHRQFGGRVPACGQLSERDRAMMELVRETPARAAGHFERYRFRDAVMEVMNLSRAANKYFNDSEPWKTAKTDPMQCATTIVVSLLTTRALAVLMYPVVPFAADRLWRMLGLPGAVADQRWDAVGSDGIGDGHQLGQPEILFTKIEDDVIEEELKKVGVPPATGGPAAAAPAVQPGPDTQHGAQPAPTTSNAVGGDAAPLVSIDDVRKVDLRVARVVSAEGVPKSKKLLRLQVDLGTEQRQIVAGIAQHYNPADLVGKLIVVVANLQPATLMGQESRGMLLAASDAEGKLVLLAPAADIAPGSGIR